MTRRPAPIPAHLGDAFTSADALAAGLTPGQVRRLPSPFHGVRCRSTPVTVEELARAATLALPVGAAIAGRTAAHLHGLWLPAPVTVETPVDAVVPLGRDLPRTTGIACRRDECEVVDVAGLPVVSPADVFVQLAPSLGLVDRVTLGDSVVRWGSGREVGVLADAMTRGRRGVGPARRALPLVRAGSASPPETHARLWLVDAGLPEPELNAPIMLDDCVAWGDLVWRDLRVVLEYQGEYHFTTKEQREDDFDRLAALRRAGWMVVEVRSGVLWDRRRRDALVDEMAAHLGVVPLPGWRRGRTLTDR